MRRVFYPIQSNAYDMFCSTSDLMSIQETQMFFNPQPSPQPQLANWQINPPPYPFKITNDNFSGFPITVTKEGINTYAFGTPIIANIKDPMYSGYRVCREGECGDINPNLSYKEPSLADWQINPPPYPFKITNDNFKMYIPPIIVTKEGISSRDDFGRPIFVNIKDPAFSGYRLCKEGECDNIPELTTTRIGL